ncbi:MAG: hypothetical protein U0821_22385 [Chloroflexota bacterium]
MEYTASPDPPRAVEPAVPSPAAYPSSKTASKAAQRQLERQARRSARWEEVHRRGAAGQSIQHIARALGMNRQTVRNLLAAPLPPAPAPRPRPGGLQSPTLQPFVSYLQDRWQAGCQNVRQVQQLCREITAQGYQGSYSLLEQSLFPWRPPRSARSGAKRRSVSVRSLCRRPRESLSETDRQTLERALAEVRSLPVVTSSRSASARSSRNET